jgi:hypothetical protein
MVEFNTDANVEAGILNKLALGTDQTAFQDAARALLSPSNHEEFLAIRAMQQKQPDFLHNIELVMGHPADHSPDEKASADGHATSDAIRLTSPDHKTDTIITAATTEVVGPKGDVTFTPAAAHRK